MHTHWNFWAHCFLAPSYHALMAAYQMYWSTSTSIHNPLSRLAALTSSKRSLSRGMSFLSLQKCWLRMSCDTFLALPWLWAEWSHTPLPKQLLLQGHCKICSTNSWILVYPSDLTSLSEKKILFCPKNSDWCSLQHLSFVNSCLPRVAVINHKWYECTSWFCCTPNPLQI